MSDMSATSKVTQCVEEARAVIRAFQERVSCINHLCDCIVKSVETQGAAVKVLFEQWDSTSLKPSKTGKGKHNVSIPQTCSSALQDMLSHTQSTTALIVKSLKESFRVFNEFSQTTLDKFKRHSASHFLDQEMIKKREDDLTIEIDRLQEEVKSKETEIDDLKNRLQKEIKENEKTQCSIDHVEKTRQSEDTLRLQIDNLEKELRDQLKAAQSVEEDQYNTITTLVSEREQLINDNKKAKEEIDKVKEEKKKLSMKFEKQTTDLVKMGQENCKINERLNYTERQLMDEKESSRGLDVRFNNKNIELQMRDNSIKEMEKQRTLLTLEISNLKENLNEFILKEQEMKAQSDALLKARRQTATVQLYCPTKTTITDSALSELSKCMGIQFETEDTTASINTIENLDHIRPDYPLVVLCINASRLGSDIENSIKGLEGKVRWQNIVCVVLHNRELHALPSTQSNRLLTSQQYRRLGAILDIAFMKDKGMYTCDMNNDTLQDLTKFIKSRCEK